MTKDFVLAGKLGKPFGLKGFLKLIAQESSLTSLKLPIAVRLVFPGSRPSIDTNLVELKGHSSRLALRFEGIDTPEKASKLIGADLMLSHSLLPALKQQEYYLFELIGLKAYSEEGKDLGWTLTDLIENPAHPILEFHDTEREILIPFIENFVGKVQIEEGKIYLKQPEQWDEV
ncbi:16S rRNA processing protein RimM [Leptospira perolatii]|uniref:Ribosome maturation factor RimM n=1 Tax=Leptospira perolatii TaxID=2023191 RepID=A0A2M9ZJ17_9LEPT|nr:ribosome maturation factor RimM [Leptospira perolatii]PJZ69542.1 16S rRNA processing protein RimM [Leptospira perolatii]PJZ72057.1 16S rRNA processing protein RimM [Leptospira perolatii]